MNPQKHNMTVLAQIARWIPDRIVENLARKHKIQARSFSADSHVMAMLYAHLAHSLSLNDVCDSLRNHGRPPFADSELHAAEPQRPVAREHDAERRHGRGAVLDRLQVP